MCLGLVVLLLQSVSTQTWKLLLHSALSSFEQLENTWLFVSSNKNTILNHKQLRNIYLFPWSFCIHLLRVSQTLNPYFDWWDMRKDISGLRHVLPTDTLGNFIDQNPTEFAAGWRLPNCMQPCLTSCHRKQQQTSMEKTGIFKKHISDWLMQDIVLLPCLKSHKNFLPCFPVQLTLKDNPV